MFEEVRGLRVDLERVLFIEQVRVEPFVGHTADCITTEYQLSRSGSLQLLVAVDW